jgi:hypothetical protein
MLNMGIPEGDMKVVPGGILISNKHLSMMRGEGSK